MGIGREIMFTTDDKSILPYRLYMAVIEFKDKIEVRLTYDGMHFDCEKETMVNCKLNLNNHNQETHSLA